MEGKNDIHVIWHLLNRNGINLPIRKQPVGDVAPSVPELQETNGKQKLLDTIKTAVPVSSDRPVGFVLDADDKPQDRWSAVRARLREFELDPPNDMPADGYVTDVEKYKTRVGVWMMPDNTEAGALEELLMGLIDKYDCLLPLAESSTNEAHERSSRKGAKFLAAKHSKAVLHTWLAWQENPGLPYGTAINAQFFRHDSPAALAFVQWYKRLFSSPDQC
ncbi:hypothetical protein BV61_02855 [Candidatus Synechococcus spongiarum LMB bulk15M]|uniref:Uncharacterized protein n=1 Tax=Candidatus Synechococcus spongiarum LMB bulk15M TaxID=1943582 RepID=A0A1T1D0Q9_9SYNE|nr:hypothetical protein BV61_02855 [Candidatus Synechococcus spongiarum LMB bulk15M]